jgi:hypothetical protein
MLIHTEWAARLQPDALVAWLTRTPDAAAENAWQCLQLARQASCRRTVFGPSGQPRRGGFAVTPTGTRWYYRFAGDPVLVGALLLRGMAQLDEASCSTTAPAAQCATIAGLRALSPAETWRLGGMRKSGLSLLIDTRQLAENLRALRHINEEAALIAYFVRHGAPARCCTDCSTCHMTSSRASGAGSVPGWVKVDQHCPISQRAMQSIALGRTSVAKNPTRVNASCNCINGSPPALGRAECGNSRIRRPR